MIDSKRLRTLVCKLHNESIGIAERVETLHVICIEAGFCHEFLDQAKFISVLGLDALVHISMDEWPESGNLARSRSKFDVVVPSKGGYWSMRRAAITALAEMSNYIPYTEQMWEVGLFLRFPQMLQHTFLKYQPGKSRRLLMRTLKDATHFVCERIVNICANSVSTPVVQQFLLNDIAPLLIRHFVVPDEDDPAERRSSREAEQRHDRLWDDLAEPPYDIMPYNFCRFFANILQITPDAKKVEFVEMGLLQKLRNCKPSAMGETARGMATSMAEQAWDRHMCAQRTAAQAQATTAQEWRQRGNEFFNQGDYAGAISAYSKGIAIHNGDVALLTNRSLCRLKVGKVKGAEGDARDALAINPWNKKAWCRLGDAYRAQGEGRARAGPHAAQLPAMCYAAALEASPGDPELTQRLAEATEALAGEAVWKVEDIPDMGGDIEAYMRWCQWVGLPRRAALPRGRHNAMSGDLERDLERISKTAKGAVSLHLKPVIQRAKALAGVMDVRPQRGFWSVSWTDTSLRQRSSGHVTYIINVCNNETGGIVADTMCLGVPCATTVLATLACAICYPRDGSPACRPYRVLLAHRMSDMFELLKGNLARWGVTADGESRLEAELTAARHGTHPLGLNNLGAYRDAKSEDEEGD